MTPRHGGNMSGPVPEKTIGWLWGFGWGAIIAAAVIGLLWVTSAARADSFYPACLKPDGEWLHGVTRKECIGKDVRGRWFTKSVLKKAQRVM